MDSKKIIKLILYFVPIILIHIMFIVISKNFHNQLSNGIIAVDSINNLLYIELFFYFWIIPIYLAWVNFISHIGETYFLYNKDIKFTYLSIFVGNICTLIFNCNNNYIGIQTELNCFLEFGAILFIQCVVLAMTSFLGLLLIQIMDEDDDNIDQNMEESKEIITTDESSVSQS